LDGTTATIDLTVAGTDYGSQTVTVGAGPDAKYFGNQQIDFNAGINGDLFTISSAQGFCGIQCGGGNVVWTLRGLNFGKPSRVSTSFKVSVP
jgi:hypothetical protein